ncbi:MAG: phosphoribosylamine--glycine ligase [Armatimonadota bacterium]|nr:phosphoribosylamine--glycine ligase [Armatimonadota bacterium]
MAYYHTLFVVGGGGREHALAWHLRRCYPHARLYCAPGNPGIARGATCLPIPPHDLTALADAAAALAADLTIVGPEAPLVAGLADLFKARGLPVLGPGAAAAALEGSKAFAKALMERHGIPTARYGVFDGAGAALAYIEQAPGPLVVKADGLAAGKGVVVCDEPDQARAAARAMLAGAFGQAGRRIVIEERLEGDEVSVFALVDGEAAALLPAAQDHKRLGDGDCGPNTGGMGAAAPYPLSEALRRRILREIIEPVARAMCAEGHPYRGVLFAGLMLTRDGPKVLEFNCRLGDPEAQVILPLLRIGLPDAVDALHAGRLGPHDLATPEGAAVGVVLAARGYPGAPEVGVMVEGLEAAAREALVFHSGTAERDGRVVTAGGRVVTVVGCDATPRAARERAYRAVASVAFAGMQYRRDIGARLLAAPVAGRA